MARQHDADLCDRIRALEKEVEDLKDQLAAQDQRPHGATWVYPYWPYPYQTWPQPHYPYWTVNTSGTLNVGGTANIDSFSQFTLTGD